MLTVTTTVQEPTEEVWEREGGFPYFPISQKEAQQKSFQQQLKLLAKMNQTHSFIHLKTTTKKLICLSL